MIVLLPKAEDGLSSLENEVDFEKLNEWTRNLTQTRIHEIYLPKFEFELYTEVVEPLIDLWMDSAFSQTNADFSKMTGNRDLYVSNILHKAFVKVDEEGTEAAAATVVVVMAPTSAGGDPTPQIIFKADHPFIFMIRENSTGAILFMGRITDPSA
jgi:serpin B